jgi:hypothetical protein
VSPVGSHTVAVCALIGLSLGCGSPRFECTETVPGFANCTTPRDLESLNPVGCVGVESITPNHTPADLYPGVAECAREGEIRRASFLYAFAYSYGIFDTKRVSDRTAHQAVPMLARIHLSSLPLSARESTTDELVRAYSTGSVLHREVCSELRRIGPPEYHPRYMIQHGMGAYLGEPRSAPADFDRSAAWEKVLTETFKCRESSA